MPFTKLAAKRGPGYPVGQPAPMYLDCLCGAHLPMNYDNGKTTTCFDWGIIYLTPLTWRKERKWMNLNG